MVAGTPTQRPPHRADRVANLAARPEGVTNADMQAALHLSPTAAGALLAAAEKRLGLAKASAPGGRTHWFSSEQAAHRWQAREFAMLQARLRALGRIAEAAALDHPQPPPEPRRPRAKKPRVELTLGRDDARRVTVSTAAQRATLKVAPASWATTPPIINSATKVTVYERTPEPGRIDLMAVPQPTVPGWAPRPNLGEGALDYRQFQQHSRGQS